MIEERLRMETNIERSAAVDPLDRVINLAAVRWATLVAVIALLTGSLLRLIQLDIHALSSDEATWAYDSYLFFRGQSPAAGERGKTGTYRIVRSTEEKRYRDADRQREQSTQRRWPRADRHRQTDAQSERPTRP